MNKIISLLFALIITLLTAQTYYTINTEKKDLNLDSVILSRVIDGDTIVVDDTQKVRLLNINSPEKSSPLYLSASNFLKQYQGKLIYLEYQGADRYNRELARVYNNDKTYLNLELVKLGFASKFLVNKNELSTYSNAESEAIESGKGIWNHSEYYGCISTSIDKKKELVYLKNSCESINLSNYYIKDESRKTLILNTSIYKELTIFSRNCTSNSTFICWNSETDVWNDDRDTLYLFDSADNIVLASSYGY